MAWIRKVQAKAGRILGASMASLLKLNPLYMPYLKQYNAIKTDVSFCTIRVAIIPNNSDAILILVIADIIIKP